MKRPAQQETARRQTASKSSTSQGRLAPRSLIAFPVLAALVIFFGAGCSSVERLGMRILFEPTPWPEGSILEDVVYVEGESADGAKQRLDYFMPEGEGWPSLIFVHGGSWRWGDKDLLVGGREVYGNIGRFYASKGVGVAVISYRLQPNVNWLEQVDDVASSVRRVVDLATEHGGDPGSIFLSGHSAGAQLASFAALDQKALAAADRRRVCGVVAISGAGYDPGDEKTYELGADPEFYDETFRVDDEADWAERASTLARAGTAGSPPAFLIFIAEKDHEALHHQAELLHGAIEGAGGQSELIEVPRWGHRRIVVELSQEDAALPRPILDFIAAHRGCGSDDAASL